MLVLRPSVNPSKVQKPESTSWSSLKYQSGGFLVEVVVVIIDVAVVSVLVVYVLSDVSVVADVVVNLIFKSVAVSRKEYVVSGTDVVTLVDSS